MKTLTREPKATSPIPLVPSPERSQVLLERVLAVYQQDLVEAVEARPYLEAHGISDQALVKRHRLGFCQGRLTKLLPQEGAIWEELQGLGVFLADHQERFKGSLVIPLLDAEGKITSLCAHRLAPGPKPKASLPQAPSTLWNSPALNHHANILLVNSILDGLGVMMAGAMNVVACLGEALTRGDVNQLAQHQVTLLVDSPSTAQAFKTSLAGMECATIILPERYLVTHGPQALLQLVSTQPDSSIKGIQPLADGFAITLGLRRYSLHGLEKGPRKLKATVRVEQSGKLHVDTLDFYQARSRRILAQDLARIYEQSAETVELEITRLMGLCEAYEPPSAHPFSATQALSAMNPQAKGEAQTLGKSVDLLERILADFERCGLVGERHNKLLCYLAMVSRKMEHPLSVLILSSSGAGKTTLQDAALLFCPPEDVVKLTSLSGKALFYKEQSSLKHKVLALEEGDGMHDAQYAIRNLISAGELVIESTIKDLATGKLTTMENRVEGPTAVFITTTNPETDPETKSRFFVTSVDESREQTQAILAFQRRRHTLAGLSANLEMTPIVECHRNFQRLLQPLAVVNPFADQLHYQDDRLQGRRDQPKYLNLINAVAFLRQMQKEVKHWEAHGQARSYIEVDATDLQLATDLASHILGHSLDELSRPGHELLLLLEAMKKDKTGESFSRRDIREYSGWSNARVHRYLKELVELEYVVVESGRNGSLHRYRLVYEGQGKQGERFLLGLKPIQPA